MLYHALHTGEDDASEDVDDEELSLKQPIKVNSHNPGVLARLLPTSNKSSVKRPGFSLGARLLTLFRSDPKVKVIDPCKLLSMSSTPERFQAVFELFDEFEAYVSSDVCVLGGGGGGMCVCNRNNMAVVGGGGSMGALNA